jgi:hypothetical protein
VDLNEDDEEADDTAEEPDRDDKLAALQAELAERARVEAMLLEAELAEREAFEGRVVDAPVAEVIVVAEVAQLPPRRPPTLAVLIARGADF